MPFIRLTKIERRRVFSLFACLLLAIGAWFFMALNNKYVYAARTVLIYKNFPQKRAFHPLQSDTVDLQVEGTGWQLLFDRLRIKPQSIFVNLNKLNTREFIVFSDQLLAINKQLESAQKVISVKPDTLYFDFTQRTVKRVPVRLVKNIEFVKQFGISDDIELTPKYVTVTGPIEELKKIKDWSTDTLTLNKVAASTTQRIRMQHSKFKNVGIFPSSVEVKVPIDEFTEKTVDVPLLVKNNVNYDNIQLYPKKVKVTFLVALNHYAEIDESFIKATVDLNEWRNFGHKQFTVNITEFPEYCKLLSIVPAKVDFIIQR
ncbi:CdaR family protein [Pedobacter sp. MW01-1-1]|uniref:CdaR family protein n=1 Tax=Pedobacter sp. MW01-1-1 TaxID=3383027 RepID=UPI003FF0ADFC